jgi:hypothetical protein
VEDAAAWAKLADAGVLFAAAADVSGLSGIWSVFCCDGASRSVWSRDRVR